MNNMRYGKERSDRVMQFLNEVAELCEKHELSIGHEDTHGAFIVFDYSKCVVEWILAAHDSTEGEHP